LNVDEKIRIRYRGKNSNRLGTFQFNYRICPTNAKVSQTNVSSLITPASTPVKPEVKKGVREIEKENKKNKKEITSLKYTSLI
jgi:hypothetical protein